jgi:hypothetical protein
MHFRSVLFMSTSLWSNSVSCSRTNGSSSIDLSQLPNLATEFRDADVRALSEETSLRRAGGTVRRNQLEAGRAVS